MEISSRVSILSSGNLRRKLEKKLEDLYRKEIKQIGKDLNIGVSFGQSDKNILETIVNNKKLGKALNDIDSVTSRKIQEVIQTGLIQSRSLDEIRNKLVEVVDITESRAHTIALTESQRVQTLARENSYKKILDLETADFKWIGPTDRRTTPICERIKNRTKNGVSLERLQEIIKQEADPQFYDSSSPYSPHWNCRHIFVRTR